MSRAKASDKVRMGKVAALGCMLCRHLRLADDTPAIVHHVRTGMGKMRAPHTMTVPLCPPHHQHSGFGLHDMGRQQFAAMYGVSELELLEMTDRLLGEVESV